MKWTSFTEDEIIEDNAALKVQSMWRGIQVRKDIQPKQKKSVIARKGICRNNRYYFVVVIEQDTNYLVNIHVADDPLTPMD